MTKQNKRRSLLYCTQLYCTVLYCIVLYCALLNSIPFYPIQMYYIIPYSILFHPTLFYSKPHQTMSQYTTFLYTARNNTTPHYDSYTLEIILAQYIIIIRYSWKCLQHHVSHNLQIMSQPLNLMAWVSQRGFSRARAYPRQITDLISLLTRKSKSSRVK